MSQSFLLDYFFGSYVSTSPLEREVRGAGGLGVWMGGGGRSSAGRAATGASVTVALVRVLGALLGRRRVSHGALGLSGSLDVALVTKAGAGMLTRRESTAGMSCFSHKTTDQP